MQTQTIQGVSFVPAQRTLTDIKLYLFTCAFVLGNLIFPMIVHTIPNGGLIFLPLFFFTLVAAYSEGFLAGILVAVASPLINYAVTKMPPMVMLPTILFQSLLIAVSAAFISSWLKKIDFSAIAIIVVATQILAGFFDYFISGSVASAIHTVELGIPGMIIMAVGGYVLLKIIAKMRAEHVS